MKQRRFLVLALGVVPSVTALCSERIARFPRSLGEAQALLSELPMVGRWAGAWFVYCSKEWARPHAERPVQQVTVSAGATGAEKTFLRPPPCITAMSPVLYFLRLWPELGVGTSCHAEGVPSHLLHILEAAKYCI